MSQIRWDEFSEARQLTLCRWWRRFDRHDLSTLEERSHRPHCVRQPTWSAAAAERLLALRRENPCWGSRCRCSCCQRLSPAITRVSF